MKEGQRREFRSYFIRLRFGLEKSISRDKQYPSTLYPLVSIGTVVRRHLSPRDVYLASVVYRSACAFVTFYWLFERDSSRFSVAWISLLLCRHAPSPRLISFSFIEERLTGSRAFSKRVTDSRRKTDSIAPIPVYKQR